MIAKEQFCGDEGHANQQFDTVTMITNDLIDCDDDCECSIATMVTRTVDSGCNDDHEQARRSTATKIALTQQSTSSITKTFVTTSKHINCKQKARVIATVGQLD